MSNRFFKDIILPYFKLKKNILKRTFKMALIASLAIVEVMVCMLPKTQKNCLIWLCLMSRL